MTYPDVKRLAANLDRPGNQQKWDDMWQQPWAIEMALPTTNTAVIVVEDDEDNTATRMAKIPMEYENENQEIQFVVIQKKEGTWRRVKRSALDTQPSWTVDSLPQ